MLTLFIFNMNHISSLNTRISHISWGTIEITVNTETFKFKDCKIWPGKAKEWDWRLTKTRHTPGIPPQDIDEILNEGVEIIILSKGMECMLNTCPETEQLLQSKNIEYYKAETTIAVNLFNEFSARGKNVGGIFHSTC